MAADWRTHTHKSDDPWNYQHGPNTHTHGTTGKVDTVMGLSVNALHELEKARLERAAAGQGPNEIEPCETCDGKGSFWQKKGWGQPERYSNTMPPLLGDGSTMSKSERGAQ